MPDGGHLHVRARYEAGYPSDYNPAPPVAGSADAELYAAGERLRDWARYLAKNSAIVTAVLDARCTKGIGPGLRYEPMVKDRQGKLLTPLNDKIRDLHATWSERADVTGELARAEVERLVWRDWDTAGEVFARQVYRGRTRDRLGYQLQLIPSELVPYGWLTREGAEMGIERDEWGGPLRYWVFPYNPRGQLWHFRLPSLEPQPVEANFIIQLKRQEELNATRGVTLFHAVIFRASDIAEYQQAHRRAARASANLFASINRSPEYIAETTDPEATQTLNLNDLVLLDWLKAGESVNFHTPSHPNQNAIEFVNQEIRQFSAACRVAFSWIAYVFDRAFAAQRTEHTHAWEFIYEDRAHFVRDFAKPALYDAPLRIAIAEGRISQRELRRADPSTLYHCRIEGPVMPSINPSDDRKAAQIDEQMGWESRHGNIRRFGRDPAQVDAERANDSAAPAPSVPQPAPGSGPAAEPAPDRDDPSDDTAPAAL
jgi:lambda family phage portal protein